MATKKSAKASKIKKNGLSDEKVQATIDRSNELVASFNEILAKKTCETPKELAAEQGSIYLMLVHTLAGLAVDRKVSLDTVLDDVRLMYVGAQNDRTEVVKASESPVESTAPAT